MELKTKSFDSAEDFKQYLTALSAKNIAFKDKFDRFYFFRGEKIEKHLAPYDRPAYLSDYEIVKTDDTFQLIADYSAFGTDTTYVISIIEDEVSIAEIILGNGWKPADKPKMYLTLQSVSNPEESPIFLILKR